MKHALAHGEQFTRLRIRVSPSELLALQRAGVVLNIPAVYRKSSENSVLVQERRTVLNVQDRQESLVKVVNGWHEVSLERKTLLSKDPNHKWLRICLEEIRRVVESPDTKVQIPTEFRQVFLEPSDILYRRQGSVLKVRGKRQWAKVTYLITKVHQMRSVIEDNLDFVPSQSDLPPASPESLDRLVNYYHP